VNGIVVRLLKGEEYVEAIGGAGDRDPGMLLVGVASPANALVAFGLPPSQVRW
jgi:hypothetical protein